MSRQSATVLLNMLLASILWTCTIAMAKAEVIVLGGKEIQLVPMKKSKGAIKGFDQDQRDLLQYQLPHRYMAAYLVDREEVSNSRKEDLNHHQKMSAAYGAATAYEYSIGQGVDASGLAHMGMNLILSLGDVNKKQFSRSQVDELGQFVYLAKVFDDTSPEKALMAGIGELQMSGYEDWCGFKPRTEPTYYVPERYIAMPISCSKRESDQLMTSRTVRHYPGLEQLITTGYEVAVSFQMSTLTEIDRKARKETIEAIRTKISDGWYVMAAEHDEKSTATQYVVWKDGVERRYPFPKL